MCVFQAEYMLGIKLNLLYEVVSSGAISFLEKPKISKMYAIDADILCSSNTCT